MKRAKVRQMMNPTKNIFSQGLKEELKVLWRESNHRFEKMEIQFKEIRERFDRNEKRTNEMLKKHEDRVEKQLATNREVNQKQLDEQKNFFQQLLSSLKKMFNDEKKRNDRKHVQTTWAIRIATMIPGAINFFT